MPKQSYVLKMPETRRSAVVFASPHSGRDYPKHFVKSTILDENTIRTSEDAFVDELFDCVVDFGCPLLCAGAPRAFVDLNRAADEFDPALIEEVRKSGHNPRIASGLGVIPRVVAGGRAIYRGKLPLSEAHRRISEYWRPYHDTLQMLLDQSRNSFGRAILVDCHSMPHEAISNASPKGQRPDIVLGDRFGASASGDIVDRIESAFAEAGLNVARNSPFAGAFVAQNYGRPTRDQHVIQIEVDRSLYMNEAELKKSADFATFQKLVLSVSATISDIGRGTTALAAE